MRPDLVIKSTRQLISSVFSNNFMNMCDRDSLETVTLSQTKSSSPLLLVCRPGFDPSSSVDELALKNGLNGNHYNVFLI